jgi:hypothetical protein
MIAVLGWLGSGLVVTSLIQRDIGRLRQLNLAASVALGVFNLALGIWSMIVLNIVLAAVNSYHLLAGRSRARRTVSPSPLEQIAATRPSSSGAIRLEESVTVLERHRAAAGMPPSTLTRS